MARRMTEDELIREIQLKRQLSELDGTPAPGYDPSDGMETIDELKGFARFLYATTPCLDAYFSQYILECMKSTHMESIES